MTLDVNLDSAWPLRREKATRTRRTIVDAASELFVSQGYVPTTIPDIAAAAGVSRATVFNSVGGKADVLKACYDLAVVGDDEPLAIYERPEMQRMFAEPDARRTIELYAPIIGGIGARISPIYEVFRAAAGADPEIRMIWASIQDERHFGASQFVRMLKAKSGLRRGLSTSDAVDIVWVHIDNGLYHRLVVERGWPRRKFERWFARTLTQQLLLDE
jgi:AcrR family transcriptional regulator